MIKETRFRQEFRCLWKYNRKTNELSNKHRKRHPKYLKINKKLIEEKAKQKSKSDNDSTIP